MDHNAKETNRPLDQEELSPNQEAEIVGGLEVNTANFNTSNYNMANVNIANLNTANIDISPKA